MPTNLTVEAKKKWNEAASARDPKEKLKLLQEFHSLIPKHKGTEKLRAQIKTKMASLRRELEERQRKAPGSRVSKFFVEKEGAAQIVILGKTNVGRSSLLASTTNAKIVTSNYPFTTREAIPGMFKFQDLQFQIVEAPPLMKGASEGKGGGQQILALSRNADGLILMVDLSKKPVEQLTVILNELEMARLLIKKPRAKVNIERKHMGVGLRIFVIGRLVEATSKDVEKLLRGYGIKNAIVKIYGNATLDDVEDSIFESVVYRPTLVLANKMDAEGAYENLMKLKNFVKNRLIVVPVSCKTGEGLKELGAQLFKCLEIIRVYTKEPDDKKPSSTPFILKKNSTIADLAKAIHSDFFKSLSYAKVWAKRLPYSPRKVGLSFVLEDRDIVEMHLR
jgi:ribosome-interacting GTPase 1